MAAPQGAATAAAAGTSGRRHHHQQQQQQWRRRRRSAAATAAIAATATATLLLLLLVALASTSAAAALQTHDNDLPTESDALAAGLGYLPSTDPSGMILLPRPVGALPPPQPSGLAVLAASASSSSEEEEERAESAELERLEGEATNNKTTKGGWAMAIVERVGNALVPPRGASPSPASASGVGPLLVVPGDEQNNEENNAVLDDNTKSTPSSRRDAFALQVQQDLQAALDDARRAYPDGDFPAPVAAAAAARVLSAQTPAELRSRTAALGEAKRRLLGYGGFASPCGPSCAPGACLPAVNPYTYAQTGSPGYLPGPFSGTGGLKYLKHYNGNGVVGLYSCRRCVNDCYEQRPYPNTNVQMCVCKPGCGIVRGAFVPVCDRGSEGDWVEDEQVRIRNGEAGAYRGSILDTPIPLVGKASEGIVVTSADRMAAQQAQQAMQASGASSPSQAQQSRRNNNNNGRSLLYIKSKQQFAAAAGCNYVRQNYCRRCPINYYQQVGNLTSAVCSPCPFDRPTTAGMTGSPTCFVVCNPEMAEAYGVDNPARPIYAYTREDCGSDDPEDPDGDILNEKYPELFPPFSDVDAATTAAVARSGESGVGGEAVGRRSWDPFSYDGPPMPLRVPRSRWVVEREKEGEGEGGVGGGDGSGLRLRGGGGGEEKEKDLEEEEEEQHRSTTRRGGRRRRGRLANPVTGRRDADGGREDEEGGGHGGDAAADDAAAASEAP